MYRGATGEIFTTNLPEHRERGNASGGCGKTYFIELIFMNWFRLYLTKFIFFRFFFEQFEIVATLAQFRFPVVKQPVLVNSIGVLQNQMGFLSDNTILVSQKIFII